MWSERRQIEHTKVSDHSSLNHDQTTGMQNPVPHLIVCKVENLTDLT